MPSRRTFVGMAMAAGGLPVVRPLVAGAAEQGMAEQKNAPGITDSEIKIGQTMPYSPSFRLADTRKWRKSRKNGLNRAKNVAM